MIISKLYGGMGNQMFQYAVARYIAHITNNEIYLDLRILQNKSTKKNYTNREFDLDLFKINAKIANESMLANIPETFSRFNKLKHKLSAKINQNIYFDNFLYVNEDFNFFDKPLKANQHDIILDDYWQQEGYFKEIEDIIRAEFTFKDIPSQKISSIEDYMKDKDSIVIQIRRTDYLTNPVNRLLFGVMDKSYFVNGLNHIKQFVKNPLILIFSDDNEWASKNLDFIKDEKIIIEDEWKGDKYQYSMYLMSRCKNFIISNSSFGWWGAWLSDYINKKVVAPKSWYKLPFYHTKVKLPSDWHQI